MNRDFSTRTEESIIFIIIADDVFAAPTDVVIAFLAIKRITNVNTRKKKCQYKKRAYVRRLVVVDSARVYLQEYKVY